MALLKLEKDDPKKELEFEVCCALQISQEDRIKKLMSLSKTMMQLCHMYDSKKTPQIIKRPIS